MSIQVNRKCFFKDKKLCHRVNLNLINWKVLRIAIIFFKWANHGLFLFIFILFKHKFYRKTVGVSGIRTEIIGVEGEHADHLTTTTAQVLRL